MGSGVDHIFDRCLPLSAFFINPDCSTLRAKLTERSVALLALAVPACTRRISSRRRIVTYMKQHYHSWTALAQTAGFYDDLVFISGTTTTTACGALAFRLPEREHEGGEPPHLSVTWNEREGAMRAEVDGKDVSGRDTCSTGVAASKDAKGGEAPLCVFVHYWKMRRRLWFGWRALQAASGPHQLPKRREDDEEPPRVRAGDGDANEGLGEVCPICAYSGCGVRLKIASCF